MRFNEWNDEPGQRTIRRSILHNILMYDFIGRWYLLYVCFAYLHVGVGMSMSIEKRNLGRRGGGLERCGES